MKTTTIEIPCGLAETFQHYADAHPGHDGNLSSAVCEALEQFAEERSAKSSEKKRKRPAYGGWIAYSILDHLWERRREGVERSKLIDVAEIEWWEDFIRAAIREKRRAPREILELDSATVAALNECFPDRCRGSVSMKDYQQNRMREFLLHLIRMACENLILNEDQRRWGLDRNFSVSIRDMTKRDKRYALLEEKMNTLEVERENREAK